MRQPTGPCWHALTDETTAHSAPPPSFFWAGVSRAWGEEDLGQPPPPFVLEDGSHPNRLPLQWPALEFELIPHTSLITLDGEPVLDLVSLGPLDGTCQGGLRAFPMGQANSQLLLASR